MNKLKIIICVIALIYYACLTVQTMTRDIVKMRKVEPYEISNVKIEKITGIGSDRHIRMAHFKYEHDDGSVICNFWEQEGDVIEVAYTDNEGFIRTGLILSDHWVVECVWITIGIVALIYYFVKNKDYNK